MRPKSVKTFLLFFLKFRGHQSAVRYFFQSGQGSLLKHCKPEVRGCIVSRFIPLAAFRILAATGDPVKALKMWLLMCCGAGRYEWSSGVCVERRVLPRCDIGMHSLTSSAMKSLILSCSIVYLSSKPLAQKEEGQKSPVSISGECLFFGPVIRMTTILLFSDKSNCLKEILVLLAKTGQSAKPRTLPDCHD